MQITLHYFAGLAEAAAKNSESIEIQNSDPVRLFMDLQEKYHWHMSHKHCCLAINDEFAPWQTLLHDGDRIVFMPPFAGG